MLRKLQQLREKEEGFTIIEVLIVLAIAALILVIVLIAIPQLQRNQRNTARKNDISRIATTINEFQANNNGALPCPTGMSDPNCVTALNQIITSLGNLGQYTLTPKTTPRVALVAADLNRLTIVSGTQGALVAIANNPLLGSVQIVTAAECDTATTGATVANSNTRKVALQYQVEAGGTTNPVCQNVQ